MSKLQTYISERKKLWRESFCYPEGHNFEGRFKGSVYQDAEKVLESFNEETIEGCMAIVREVVDFERVAFWGDELLEQYTKANNAVVENILQALNTKE